MFERVNSGSVQMDVQPAGGRQTADNSFGAMLERGALSAVSAIGNGVQAVASFVPGGGYISAVVDTVQGAVGAAAGAGGGAGSDKWALLNAQERLQREGLDSSLRLLALQRKMNKESQAFSAISNVMKVRHDMAKTAINNIG